MGVRIDVGECSTHGRRRAGALCRTLQRVRERRRERREGHRQGMTLELGDQQRFQVCRRQGLVEVREHALPALGVGCGVRHEPGGAQLSAIVAGDLPRSILCRLMIEHDSSNASGSVPSRLDLGAIRHPHGLRIQRLPPGPDARVRSLHTAHQELLQRLGSRMHLRGEAIVDQGRGLELLGSPVESEPPRVRLLQRRGGDELLPRGLHPLQIGGRELHGLLLVLRAPIPLEGAPPGAYPTAPEPRP